MLNEHDRYDSLIRYYAERNNLDWLQIKSQIKQESAFDPVAGSRVGAKGLGQFMDPTWSEWSGNLREQGFDCWDVYNPEHNIMATCAYMRWLLRQFNQDIRLALAAYNWGIGNVKKTTAKHGDSWFSRLPDETKKYLVRINENYNDYMKGIDD
jgi:soluble lytic murein transglycosylase-like protein